MNLFFFTKTIGVECSLQIPRFKNDGTFDLNYKLFCADIVDNKWSIKESNCRYDNNFYYVTCDESNYDTVYFLAKFDEIRKFIKSNILNNYNDYTDTTPEFRASLILTNEKNGFSSYQSEYPYSMVNRKGSLITSASILSNYKAVRNIIFIKNIYYKPEKIKFPLYLVDLKLGTIIKHYNLLTNTTQAIDIDVDLNNNNLYFVSKNYLGIPIFLSEDETGQLSFEHTHPPHENTAGEFKIENVKNYRNKFNKIVNKAVL
jgi:hypothetical protein